MVTLACLTHWYVSMLYVVPVVGVGAWGWWSSRRLARRRASAASQRSAAAGETAGRGSVVRPQTAGSADIS